MNFFLQIHRSIFDLPFYREVPLLGRRAVLLFVTKLVLVASVFSAVLHTCYVFSPSRGTVTTIAAAMKGIEIKDCRLLSERPLPYEIPAQELKLIRNCLMTIPLALDTMLSMRVIVDTSADHPAGTLPGIVMRSGDVAVYSMSGDPRLFPYCEKDRHGSGNLQFTESGTKRLLKKAAGGIFIINLLWDGSCCAALVLFCICMLGLAAYIFRIDRGRTIAYYFGIAGFAITPVPIGMSIIALADVNIPGSWRFLVIMSVVVMFRALMDAMKPAKEAGSGGEQ